MRCRARVPDDKFEREGQPEEILQINAMLGKVIGKQYGVQERGAAAARSFGETKGAPDSAVVSSSSGGGMHHQRRTRRNRVVRWPLAGDHIVSEGEESHEENSLQLPMNQKIAP